MKAGCRNRLLVFGLRGHWARMHRLLKGLLLKSPGVLSAREFVPPFGLCNPFSPIQGVGPRPLQAMQLHHRTIAIAHRLSFLFTTLFALLLQSHYDYATELLLV